MIIDEIMEMLTEEGFRPTRESEDIIVFTIRGCRYAIALFGGSDNMISFLTIQAFENTSMLSEYWALEESVKITSEIIIGRCVFLERQKQDNSLVFRASIDTFCDFNLFKKYFNEYVIILQTMLNKIVSDIPNNNVEDNARFENESIIQ